MKRRSTAADTSKIQVIGAKAAYSSSNIVVPVAATL